MAEHLTIILLTYQRTEYAVRTVQAVNQFIRYPNWSWYLADDGSDPEHVDAVRDAMMASCREVSEHSERLSYGASANRALDWALERGHLVLMLEDDWELTRPLDIWPWAALLMEHAEVGMVRMGYLNAGLLGRLDPYPQGLYWTLNDEHSRHHSSFAFAGHPAIMHSRFFEELRYPERWQPGETELRMCWEVSGRLGTPSILWPVDLGGAGPWGHIGAQQSYTWNGGRPEEV